MEIVNLIGGLCSVIAVIAVLKGIGRWEKRRNSRPYWYDLEEDNNDKLV
jgi:hypothetical protein